MGIEAIGSIGSAVGSVASAVGRGVSSVGRVSAEAGPAVGHIGRIVNEGPVGLADLKATVSLQAKMFNPVGEIRFNEPLSVPDVLAEAELILSQAKKSAINSVPLLSLRDPAFGGAKQSRLEYNPTQIAAHSTSLRVNSPRNDELIEPMFRPFVVTVASPALEPAVKVGSQTGSGVANETEPAATPQPVLQEMEEEVSERVAVKQIDTVEEEETEESRLKNVVDEEVLNTRIKEFSSAVDIVGAEVEEGSEEIDGGKIVKLVPAETEDRRSGLVKKQGPDGSRVETIEEIAFRKFGSVKEAKENIMAIIARKVPVKRAKEGTGVGYEAVVRVLKYFFVKAKPAEQMITRIVKKQKVLTKEGQKPSQVVPVAKPEATGSRIENLGLAEVFPKH